MSELKTCDQRIDGELKDRMEELLPDVEKRLAEGERLVLPVPAQGETRAGLVDLLRLQLDRLEIAIGASGPQPRPLELFEKGGFIWIARFGGVSSKILGLPRLGKFANCFSPSLRR